VLDDGGVGLGVVEREAGCPLDVPDERGSELGIVGQLGVVGGQGHEAREPEALFQRDRQIAVVTEHAFVPPRWSVHVVGPPKTSIHQ
jgi:hypothetical protein